MTGLHNPRDDLVRAIGEVCHIWAQIENWVEDIALQTAVLLQPKMREDEPLTILRIAMTNMEFRNKVSTAKAYLHLVNLDESKNLYDRAEKLLNYIDNDARVERNRYVHDTWHIYGDEIRRIKFGTKISRPKSHHRILTTAIERTYNSTNKIDEFVDNLNLVYDDLVNLYNHISWLCFSLDEESPPAHKQSLPENWSSLIHPD
ncbi:hypothetical protein [Nisaea sp.]|uniref:hypothetical protein n=1 Tax=Nisaea sp. TaxID=2024842 RepID=UPI003298A422